jgi:hypothetical protein
MAPFPLLPYCAWLFSEYRFPVSDIIPGNNVLCPPGGSGIV